MFPEGLLHSGNAWGRKPLVYFFFFFKDNAEVFEDPEGLVSWIGIGTIERYHLHLTHPKGTRQAATTSQFLYQSNMRKLVRDFVPYKVETSYPTRCPSCQKTKKTKLKYGKLLSKETESTP